MFRIDAIIRKEYHEGQVLYATKKEAQARVDSLNEMAKTAKTAKAKLTITEVKN